jgi:hypothetical protein
MLLFGGRTLGKFLEIVEKDFPDFVVGVGHRGTIIEGGVKRISVVYGENK